MDPDPALNSQTRSSPANASQSHHSSHPITHSALGDSIPNPVSSLPPKIRFTPYGKHKRPELGLRNDLFCALGEFLGTAMFLFLALGGSNFALTVDTTATASQYLYLAFSQGIALTSVAMLFVKISGSVFNPAISLSLHLIGSIHMRRMLFEWIAQFSGAITGMYLLAAVIPSDIVVNPLLSLNTTIVEGLFLEVLLTAILCFTVLMLPLQNPDTTIIGPIMVGLTLISIELVAAGLSGGGVNPARVLCSTIVKRQWQRPYLGSCVAAGIYLVLKFIEYDTERAALHLIMRSRQDCESSGELGVHRGEESNGDDEENGNGEAVGYVVPNGPPVQSVLSKVYKWLSFIRR